MGLVSAGEIEMAKNATIWLIENQGYDTIVGGWKLPNGNEYSEVTSEAGQAIFRVLQALGKPKFKVEPSSHIARLRCETFTVNITINDLSAEWKLWLLNLDFASIKLCLK
ncbi:MAG: hypothetical protein QXR45_16340 [Candidatus Bathyarchaeia archaeon]